MQFGSREKTCFVEVVYVNFLFVDKKLEFKNFVFYLVRILK